MTETQGAILVFSAIFGALGIWRMVFLVADIRGELRSYFDAAAPPAPEGQ